MLKLKKKKMQFRPYNDNTNSLHLKSKKKKQKPMFFFYKTLIIRASTTTKIHPFLGYSILN